LAKSSCCHGRKNEYDRDWFESKHQEEAVEEEIAGKNCFYSHLLKRVNGG